jgi:hypothetical protein
MKRFKKNKKCPVGVMETRPREAGTFGKHRMSFISIHEPSLDFYPGAQDNGAAIVR